MAILNLARTSHGAYIISAAALIKQVHGRGRFSWDDGNGNAAYLCQDEFEQLAGFKYRGRWPIKVEITIKRVESKP